MRVINQIVAVTGMNLRSIPQRLGSSAVIIVGIMGVVGVLISALAMAQSLASTLRATGRADRAIVLRGDVEIEPESTLSNAEIATIASAPGIARTPSGDAAVSAEFVTAVELPRRKDAAPTSVMVRSISAQGPAVRTELRLVEGRMFTPGLHEVIVGQRVQTEFRGAQVGERLRIGSGTWTIVGSFATGSGLDSTIVADTATLLSAYQRVSVNSATVVLESAHAFSRFKDALSSDPTLSVSVYREPDYFELRSSEIVQQIFVITYIICTIMAVGALFAALNTMHSAVSVRSVEIATLRAIGFGASSMLVSVLLEALVLALAGALLGAAAAWLLFSGTTINLGGTKGSLIAEMHVTSDALFTGIVWACITGFIGGFFPAMRAVRQSIAKGLRPA